MSVIGLILAADKPNEAILPGAIDEVWWGSAATLILLAAFLWKGLPFVRRLLRRRSDRIAAELEAAESARAEAEAELEAVRTSLGSVDEESRRIIAEATERAATLKADLIRRYEAEVAETLQRARVEVDAAEAQALADLREEVVGLTVGATEAVLREVLDEVAQGSLIDAYIEQVGAGR